MGDWFHGIVDREAASHEEAARLEKKMMDWLIADGIISQEIDDCVLGREGGHRPAPRYAAALADPADNDFLRLTTNGVQAVSKRQATCSSEGSFRCAICPVCRGEVPQDDIWSDAATEWYEGGAGFLACVHCAHTAPITQWDHDSPMGFGELTFTFWNWPTLSDAFLAAFDARLGHRTVFISARL